MEDATNDAKVNAAREDVAPAAAPARDADAHMIHKAKIQIFPKLKISLSRSAPSTQIRQ